MRRKRRTAGGEGEGEDEGNRLREERLRTMGIRKGKGSKRNVQHPSQRSPGDEGDDCDDRLFTLTDFGTHIVTRSNTQARCARWRLVGQPLSQM